jgi:hypothetical protein
MLANGRTHVSGHGAIRGPIPQTVTVQGEHNLHATQI